MKRLLILRHAKSSWSDAGVSDHERPLNKRGRRAVPLMGAFMSEHGYLPDGILCSSSVRTRETLERLRPHLGKEIPARFERTLYLAQLSRLLSHIRDLPAEWRCALLIGHNPGLEELVNQLRDPKTSPREALSKFPTAALAVFDFPVTSWERVDSHGGRLIELKRARELDKRG